jgi:glycosyltransferase involved in cell wall biosynthesis
VATRITIVRSSQPLPAPAPGELVVSDDQARQWLMDGRIVAHLMRYGESRLLTERLATSGRPMIAWLLRLMSRGRCVIVDGTGAEREITLRVLMRWSWHLGAESLRTGALVQQAERDVEQLAGSVIGNGVRFDRGSGPLYLRTDLSFGVRAGGSVGHIAGVLNELANLGGPPVLLTTSDIPTLRPDVEVHVVHASEAFWNFQELPTFVLNDVFDAEARRVLAGRLPSLVYQRYSLNSYAGLRIARRLGVPFVLEYNGSEVWMARHWGRPLKYESLASRIEQLNLQAADLVVVVSRAMRDELVARDIPAERILVNPNAVDPERYQPAIDGAAVRGQYGLDGKIVIGFIGTFGAWHGAEVLARAFVLLLREHPAYAQTVRLLLIGDGVRFAATRRILEEAGVAHAVACTGLVAQARGPEHMAACDILASPHVPNPDGTPFFGSPTKLFEYMAMGKGIVASGLDQIGELLRHGDTAWMVPPGDPVALAAGLARLIEDEPLRQALGQSARRDALAHHTWRAHVEKTLAALEYRLHTAA